MKYKFFGLLAILFGFVLFSSCKKIALKTTEKNQATLFNCSPKEAGMPYICFDSLLEDSRCPKGAVCFWSGTAIIQVTFHENGHTSTFKMSLQDYPGLGHISDTTINGYKIAFTDLNPYPDIFKLPQPGEKTASFSITQ